MSSIVHNRLKIYYCPFDVRIFGENTFTENTSVLRYDRMSRKNKIRTAFVSARRYIYISTVTGPALLFYKFASVILFADYFIRCGKICQYVCTCQSCVSTRLIRDPKILADFDSEYRSGRRIFCQNIDSERYIFASYFYRFVFNIPARYKPSYFVKFRIIRYERFRNQSFYLTVRKNCGTVINAVVIPERNTHNYS